MYQSSLSHSKAPVGASLLAVPTISSYQKRNDAVSSQRVSGTANRPHSSAIGNYSTSSKSKYQNTFAYRGTSVGKDGLRSITSTGRLGHGKINKQVGGTTIGNGPARLEQQSRSKNSRPLRSGVSSGATSRLLHEGARLGAESSATKRLRLAKPM